ncbi:MAG TPA: VWA domain-containing protein [Candidatus Saccharimonadales bacterium]|jgi:VWFA-related protein|nr:VWA domain-containing protein [Candidatus Saccharimonadales bacterium]
MRKLASYPGYAALNVFPLALFLAFSLTAKAPAQTQSGAPDTVIKSNTRVVILDIVATDSKGIPVTDLQEKDFTVLEGGLPQRVGSFSFQRPGPALAESAMPALPPNVVTNAPRRKSTSLNVILLDRANGESRSQIYAQDRLVKYLESGAAVQPTAIYLLDKKLSLVHGFTTDTKALKDSLNSVRPTGTGRVAQLDVAASPFATKGDFHTNENSIETTLRALKLLARTLAGYPGRKNLIWVSEAFPVSLTIEGIPERNNANTQIIARSAGPFGGAASADTPVNSQAPLNGQGATSAPDTVVAGTGHSYAEEMAKITDALMDAHVALYPVDAAGMGQADRLAAQTNMKDMADRTGGRAFYNRNDIEVGVASSVDDGSTYYALSYYPDNKSWDGHFRKIEVKTTRPGISLHYRTGYYALNPEAIAKQASVELAEEFSHALEFDSPDFSSLRFQASVVPPSDKSQPVIVNFAIDPRSINFEHRENGTEHAAIGCTVAVYREKGEPVKGIKPEVTNMTADLTAEQYQKVIKQYFPCKRTIDLKPGKYVLRLGAVDRSSHVLGTISAPVTVN